MGFSPSEKHSTTTSIFSSIIDATTGSFTEGLTVSGTSVPLVGADPDIGKETIVFQTSEVVLTTAVVVTAAFADEERDDGNWHDNSTNNSRVTVDANGLYEIKAVGGFTTNTTGGRFVFIFINGSEVSRTIIGPSSPTAGATIVTESQHVVDLTAGDFVEVKLRADFTGSCSSLGNPGYATARTQLQVARIG